MNRKKIALISFIEAATIFAIVFLLAMVNDYNLELIGL